MNTYGGGPETKGKVYPGQTFITFFSGEYSINQKWVIAFDTELLYQQKARFTGKRGFSPTGRLARVGTNLGTDQFCS